MPSDRKARRNLAAWLIPAATFVAGAVAALAVTPGPALEDPAPPDIPPVAPAALGAAPADSAVQAELVLHRDINDRFVGQLRRYETRLREIATAAEAEGAPDAAAAMRDFALETELVIDRYDLIVSKK